MKDTYVRWAVGRPQVLRWGRHRSDGQLRVARGDGGDGAHRGMSDIHVAGLVRHHQRRQRRSSKPSMLGS